MLKINQPVLVPGFRLMFLVVLLCQGHTIACCQCIALQSKCRSTHISIVVVPQISDHAIRTFLQLRHQKQGLLSFIWVCRRSLVSHVSVSCIVFVFVCVFSWFVQSLPPSCIQHEYLLLYGERTLVMMCHWSIRICLLFLGD